jgi:hypothetical protein
MFTLCNPEREMASEEMEEPSSSSAADAKVSRMQFILHQHSLFGLCFAKKDSPLLMVAGCCCVCGDSLDTRQRLFIFCFVLVANLYISLQLEVGGYSTWWAIGVSVGVLLPCTCFLRSVIRRISACGQRILPIPGLRIEEIALLVCAGLLVWWAVQERALDALISALVALATQWAVEVVMLLVMYSCCRVCCPCCVPVQSEVRRMRFFNVEEGERHR